MTMALTRAEMDRKIDEHFGFERRDDVAGVLSTLAPDAEHDIVGWPSGPVKGRDNARPFYEALFADLADGKITCLKRLYGDRFLIDESIWRGTAPGRPLRSRGQGDDRSNSASSMSSNSPKTGRSSARRCGPIWPR